MFMPPKTQRITSIRDLGDGSDGGDTTPNLGA